MTATKFSFVCEQGANFNQVITWKNSENTPVDNTGYTARMQVRKEFNTDPVVTLNTENDKIELGGVNGEVQLQLSANDTADLDAGDYLYDLELVSAGGEVSRIIEGVFSVNAEITRTE